MLVAVARLSRDESSAVIGVNEGFLIAMATGSITGNTIGSLALGVVPSLVLIPLLVVLLVLSSIKVWNQK
ncbi:hypothetical protein E3O42_10185 [Cryobacterium adonitolivorans]|uniref:Uncharacterized protein n=1 Tax=Cryobacterium adonitolivorans TaxID=1259189 RepID=A0A4R8W4G3_9MICO|nr:hypothetical protein [Cryobacterium adonitolivorans]TFC01478.1 hypothetical protein E3O42_10185 [Cryobacterium adonitolivorans]